MADLKKELYGIPKYLDVDKIKFNTSTNFADRTAQHIKTGLSEVIIEKPEPKVSSETGKEVTKNLMRSNPGRNKADRNLRKEVYKQLMSVQGSQAKRNKLKEGAKQREISRRMEKQIYRKHSIDSSSP